MNHAHIEQQMRMSTTELTVMTRLYQNAERNPLEVSASAKFESPAKVSAVGSLKAVLVLMALSTLKELSTTIAMG